MLELDDVSKNMNYLSLKIYVLGCLDPGWMNGKFQAKKYLIKKR